MRELVRTATVQGFLGRPDFCRVVWGLFFFLMPHLQNGFGTLRKGTPLLFIPSDFYFPIATAVLVGKIDLTRCKIMLCIQRQRCTSFHFNIYFKSKTLLQFGINSAELVCKVFCTYWSKVNSDLIHTTAYLVAYCQNFCREPWDEASGDTEVGQAWLEEELLTKQKLASRNIVHTNWQ